VTGGLTGADAYIRALGREPASACDWRVRVWTCRLDVERPGVIAALGASVAAAHVLLEMRMRHPRATVAPHLAPYGSTTRKGDFGEFLAAVLYSMRMGQIVPFDKLATEPMGATQQDTPVSGFGAMPTARRQASRQDQLLGGASALRQGPDGPAVVELKPPGV